jgi:thiamine biosynthesis lipoprotein
MTEIAFGAMGSQIRIVAEAPLAPGAPAQRALADARAWTDDFDRRLSRFRADSELSALNADPREIVPASALLRAAIGAAVWAARTTDGLVDPTLLRALEASGYDRSRAQLEPASLADALMCAPPRRAARPDAAARWRSVAVDDVHGTIARPAGLALDTGGTGKGLAADALLARLAGFGRVAVDCGGDVRVGGPLSTGVPFQVDVQHPLTHAVVLSIDIVCGGIATSGIDVNVWRRSDGTYAHHLLDPSSHEPAWTGLVGATALAPTALEAETRAKAAVLRGPAGGRAVLARHGGVMFADDGSHEPVGRLAAMAAAA